MMSNNEGTTATCLCCGGPVPDDWEARKLYLFTFAGSVKMPICQECKENHCVSVMGPGRMFCACDLHPLESKINARLP